MNISGINSTSSQASIISQMSERLIKKSDSNQNGSISRDEWKQAAKDAPAAPADAEAPDSDALFTKIDADGDGEITQSELESDMSSHSAEMASKGAPAGAPPAKGGGGKASSSSSSSSSSSGSSNKVYENADTNKDGTVSYAEQTAYELKHPDEAKQAAIEQRRNEPAPYARIGKSINVTI